MILIKRKKRKRWIQKINKKIQREKNVAPGERSSEDIDSKKTFGFTLKKDPSDWIPTKSIIA